MSNSHARKAGRIAIAFLSVALFQVVGCAKPPEAAPDPRLAQQEAAEKMEAAHLATFDDLDFNVFSGQKWDEFPRSHANDIVVHWPDGRTTTGLDVHIEDLKAMFVYAPDTRIRVHPIKIASGEWTSVVGEMEGTFSQPMPTPDGKSIPPTGKAFKLAMSTVGRWKDGVMVEEYLFWDNQTFMKQIGLAP